MPWPPSSWDSPALQLWPSPPRLPPVPQTPSPHPSLCWALTRSLFLPLLLPLGPLSLPACLLSPTSSSRGGSRRGCSSHHLHTATSVSISELCFSECLPVAFTWNKIHSLPGSVAPGLPTSPVLHSLLPLLSGPVPPIEMLREPHVQLKNFQYPH